jgi:hypothetical protein
MMKGRKHSFQSPLMTSGYDRINSFLLSAIAVSGFVVGAFFLMWLVGVQEPEFESTELVGLDDITPMVEVEHTEVELVLEDFTDDLIPKEKFEDVIQSVPAVTDKLSEVRHGGFNGDDLFNQGRRKGNPPLVPPRKEAARWKVNYAAEDVLEYGRQLDHFGIQVAAISLGDNQIVRFSNLSGEVVREASDRSREQETLYFAHEKSRLKIWDQTLVKGQTLGFEFDLVHFFSEQVTAQMREAELNYVKEQGRLLDEIQQTSFEIVPSSGGWNIRVAKMEFIENGKGH